MIKHAWMPFVAAALAGALSAQAPGTAAPEVEFQTMLNGGPASWAGTEGKVVLLDFSETW